MLISRFAKKGDLDAAYGLYKETSKNESTFCLNTVNELKSQYYTNKLTILILEQTNNKGERTIVSTLFFKRKIEENEIIGVYGKSEY